MKRDELLQQHYEQMRIPEDEAWQEGYRLIAGLDEAGRGPLAGPVVAAACILNREKPIYGLNDSKKLTPKRREALYEEIINQALAWRIIAVEASRIDEINILQATKEAMRAAVAELPIQPDLLLIDAVRLDDQPIPVRAIIHGDACCNAIAAASILAKVYRDRLMQGIDSAYPGYGFSRHKGYGTREHYDALNRLGPCPIHRRSFLTGWTRSEDS